MKKGDFSRFGIEPPTPGVKRWAFNRRVVEDQMVWIEAETVEEARAKLESDDVDETGDPSVVKTTYRRVPRDDY